TRTSQSQWPETSEKMRPMTAGPRTMIDTRVWMRPMTVGHISVSSPLRELLGLADLADRLGRLVGQGELHPEARPERAALDVLRSHAVAHEAAALVLEARDRVGVRHDRVRDQAHRAEARVGPVERRDAAVGLQ